MSQSRNLDDDEIDVGELILTLWASKWKLAAVTALGVAASAFHIANSMPIFQADALLQLEEKSGMLALPSSLSSMVNNDPRSVTEIEIIQSRLVLGRAIADQNLDWRIEPLRLPVIGTLFARYRVPCIDIILPKRFVRAGEILSLEQLVVPPAWVNQEIMLITEEDERFTLVLPNGDQMEGTVGAQVAQQDLGFSLTVSTMVALPGREFSLLQLDEAEAINSLRQRLSVSERGRSSGILEVRLTGVNRIETAQALNAVIQSYLRQNIARGAAVAESSLTFITEQLPQAERALREAEVALDSFRMEQVTVDLSLETQTILGQVTRVESELAELQRREDELRQRYTVSHPVYRQLLDERVRLVARLEELREQVAALPEMQRQVVNLTRNVELAQGAYTELLTRAQEVEVLRASTIGNVRIVDSAATGRYPVAPRSALVLVLGATIGFMLGLGMIFIRRWMLTGVLSGIEIEATGLSLFGTINHSPLGDSKGGRKGRMSILAIEQPTDLTIEALRSLRTSLYFGMLGANTPTVCITSSHPAAGKSFIAVNLAVVAAQAGQRVCLVDADLRRGQLRKFFDLPRNRSGLSEVIANQIPVQEALVAGPVENLSFLSTGRYPPNPSELLMRTEFIKLVEWCGDNFDLTIFDAPPVLAVTDPVIIARNIGATLFVARHSVTQLREVEAAIQAFTSAGVKLTGAVLNGFDPRKARGNYGYEYGYRYEYKARAD